MVSPAAAPLEQSDLVETDLGPLPADWVIRRVDDVCKLVNGRGFKPHEWRDRGLPIIRIQNLNGSEDFNHFDGAFNPKIEVEPGQLLFAWSGSRGTSFGPHIWPGPRGVLNYHTWKVVVDQKRVSPDFFFHALMGLTEYIEDQAHGAAALVHVQKWQMEGFQLALPPTVEEQEAIAAALSDADALIAGLESLIAKKRAIKQGAMQELLTGRRRLPGFIGEWNEGTFGELFAFLPTATNARNDLSSEGDAAYVHYGDIHTRFHDILDFSHSPLPRIKRHRCPNAATLTNGDWIMADASEDLEGVAKSVEVVGLKDGDVAVSGLHTFLLREKKPTFAPGFKGYLGNAKQLREQFLRVMTGMKVFGVSKTALRDLVLPVPAWEEQEAIRDILNDMSKELLALETRLAKARQIKQGMMQELLTGRIRLA